LRHSACADQNFSDQTILGQGDKEQQELLRGKWVYEIADLSGISKAEVEKVKAFASRTHDRARPAYGRATVEMPRRCVIWATTNNSQYLKSQTGNRRFWPIPVGKIDIGSFRRDRDQLLAEAAWYEHGGASIVLLESLWPDAAAEQEMRREVDPWEDLLQDLRGEIAAEGDERVLSQDILENHLHIPRERQTDYHAKRLSNCMRLLGWSGSKTMRSGGKRGRGYWRTSVTGGVTPP
jgi:predicted P-loop ATPase